MIGKTEDVPHLAEIRKTAEDGVKAAYYDSISGSFADSAQGADAFALWAGIGDECNVAALIKKYTALGHFDTGFLCTEILCGILLENGAEDLAYTLLTSHEYGSFGYMMDRGATTVWEQWNGGGSHDHPMFSASAGHLLYSLLGIDQKDSSAGYSELVIAPKTPAALNFAEGSVTLPIGEVCVGWERTASDVRFTISLPANCSCEFIYSDKHLRLQAGKHAVIIKQ